MRGRLAGIMASPTPPQQRPLIDPDQLEQAGRRFRQWLDGLATPTRPESDDIAWEDGEPAERPRDVTTAGG